MFFNVNEKLNDPVVRNIISCCLFDKSSEGIDKALNKYQNEQFYGWVENNELVGICGFLVLQEKVEICHIAVIETARGSGYGHKMVIALCDKYDMDIQAETDDEAVDFYRKCGFEPTAIYKQYGNEKIRRWTCVLSIRPLAKLYT